MAYNVWLCKKSSPLAFATKQYSIVVHPSTLVPHSFRRALHRHTPLMMETTNELVLETSHPHNRGIDELYPINLPGADSIKVKPF